MIPMIHTTSSNYRQIIENPHIRQEKAHVAIGKYIFSHVNEVTTLKTHLWSCVGLAGYREDGFGFLVHLKYHKDTEGLFRELREDIRTRVGCTLEDFHLTISGGNNVLSSITLTSPGKPNINAILQNLKRSPDARIHLWEKRANIVHLSLETGHFTSIPLNPLEPLNIN